MTKRRAPAPDPPTADTVREIYRAKAKTIGVVLDDDDEILLGHLIDTENDIAALNADIAARGRIVVSSTGNPKVHPGLNRVQTLRASATRLSVILNQRITGAGARSTGVAGGQFGPRGVYTGSGAQNATRDSNAAARRGVGRAARPGTTTRSV